MTLLARDVGNAFEGTSRMTMSWRCLPYCLSLAFLLAACAGEEGGAPTSPRRSDTSTDIAGDLASPSPTPTAPPALVEALAVTPTSITLTSDQSAPLSARMAAFTAMAIASGSQQPTTAVWVANPSGRLSITQGGVATVLPGALAGTVIVSASSGSLLATASVTITAALPTVQSLQVSPAELGLFAPAPDQLNTAGLPTTAQLTATVRLSDDTTEQAVTWSASPVDVATINATGRVTALKKGTAIITARSVKDPQVSAQCLLTVQAKSQVEVIVQ